MKRNGYTRNIAEHEEVCSALDEIRSNVAASALTLTLVSAVDAVLQLHQPVGRHCGRDHQRWPCREFTLIRGFILGGAR